MQNGMNSLFGGIDPATLMFGANAVHVPFNYVLQDMGHARDNNPLHLILGQTTMPKLAFGSKMPHVFVMGDMMFRPHLVIEDTDKICYGVGAEGIITSSAFCDVDMWRQRGKVLLDIYN